METSTAPRNHHRISLAIRLPICLALGSAVASCAPDPPDTIAAARRATVPIVIDPEAEARAFNGGPFYEFVVDADGFLEAPQTIPSGEIMVTLTFVGETAAPHGVFFEGLNGGQPVTAVDLPGSNNGIVTIPPAASIEFFDITPGSRSTVAIDGTSKHPPSPPAHTVAAWAADGLAFTSAPDGTLPADQPISLELTVHDSLPHSIAFEAVRGNQPLVAVDGPATSRRTVTMPDGTYIFFCAVPGHREAGMEGLITFD